RPRTRTSPSGRTRGSATRSLRLCVPFFHREKVWAATTASRLGLGSVHHQGRPTSSATALPWRSWRSWRSVLRRGSRAHERQLFLRGLGRLTSVRAHLHRRTEPRARAVTRARRECYAPAV